MIGVATSQSQDQFRSKSLSEAFPESKTPEIEEIDDEIPEQKYSEVDIEKGSELILDRRIMSSVSVRASQIKDDLCSKGDMISAVVINTDGTLTQIEYDTTPSSKNANKVLGSRFTIIGFIESSNLLILRGLNSKSNELNKHQLPSPFSKVSFNGVYLCFKIDKNGNPKSLSCEDYLAISKDSANDDDEEQFVVSRPSVWNRFVEEVRESVVSTFIRTQKYEPSDAQISDSVNATIKRTIDEMVSKYDSNVCDEEYKPELDDDTIKIVEEEEERDYDDDVLSKEERRELDSALADIKQLAKMRGRELFSNIKSTFGVNEIDFTAAACEAQDFEFRSINENELTRDEFDTLKSDAMDYARLCGKRDGRYLGNFICDTFVELNGNEPSLNELRDVFEDISYSLEMEAEEAEEEEEDEEYLDDSEDIIDDGTAYAISKIKDLNTLSPTELIEYSYRIVSEDLIRQAKSHHSIINGNENLPTSEELSDIVSNLIDYTFIDTLDKTEYDNELSVSEEEYVEEIISSEEDDDDDSSYDPESDYENEKELYDFDELEDERFEADCEDRHTFDTENEFVTTTVIESKYGNAEKYNLYFGSTQTKEVNELNLNSAIEAFRKFNDRFPEEEEIEHLKKFLNQSEDIDRIYALRDSSEDEEEKDSEQEDYVEDEEEDEEEEDEDEEEEQEEVDDVYEDNVRSSDDNVEREEEKAEEEEIDYEDTIDID